MSDEKKRKYVYPGIVKGTRDQEILIQWDIGGKSLEQTYPLDKFTNMPQVGDRFLLYAAFKEAGEKTPLVHEFIKEIPSE